MADRSNARAFRVLVVEPDSHRGANLKRLVEHRLDAEVIVATAAHDAIAALSTRVPDVVLASALLAPSEDVRLMNHLKGLRAARAVAVLAMGATIDAADPQQTRRDRPAFFRRRTSPPTSVDYDAIVARIEDALERSRMEGNVANIHLAKGNATVAPSGVAPVPVAAGHVSVTRRVRRQRAQRWTRAELPWLSSAQTSAGVELQLVNISRTGFLAECSSKFEPNASVEVRLAGAQTSLLVPVRFVRSEVARVDALGVRYSLAAVFQKKLELLSDQSGSSAGPVTAGDVADLLAKATRASDSEPAAGSARTMFEHGLRSLIGARDVAIVDRLDSAAGGEDGVCFTIPCVDGTPAVLQVTFEAGQLPGRDEFALLRAAAAAAAVLLHHEASSHRRTTLAFDDAPSLRSSRAARLAPARSTTAKTSISDR